MNNNNNQSSNLNLYFVGRKDKIGYDQYSSFIVACNNEEEARNTNPNGNDMWGRRFGWISKEEISELDVEYLGEAKPTLEKGIILDSFHAG